MISTIGGVLRLDSDYATQHPGPGAHHKMRTPLLIMIGADKGGVGKTTIARALDDYLQARRAMRRVFDGEYPNGDLKRFVQTAEIVDIDKVDDQMRVFDSVDSVTVVDVRAGLLSPTLRSLQEVKILDDVRSGGLNLALLHVLGPSVSSLREIADTATMLGAGVKHFLVKNYVNESGFDEWAKDERFAALLAAAVPNTINVPHLSARACTEVQQLGVSFDAFAKDGARSRMLRGYVAAWLKQVQDEFDRVGLGALVDNATKDL